MEPAARRSKQLALAFLLGALLVGGVMGFTVDRLLVRDQLCPKWNEQQSVRSRLGDDLSLTPAQRAMVDSILDRRNERMALLMRPIRPQLDALRDSARVDIRRLLDPEQQTRWDAILREIADTSSGRAR